MRRLVRSERAEMSGANPMPAAPESRSLCHGVATLDHGRATVGGKFGHTRRFRPFAPSGSLA